MKMSIQAFMATIDTFCSTSFKAFGHCRPHLQEGFDCFTRRACCPQGKKEGRYYIDKFWTISMTLFWNKGFMHHLACQGIFSSVIKDFTGSKAKPLPEVETEDATESIKELYTIFLTANFPSDTENRDNLVKDEDDIDLDIGMIFMFITNLFIGFQLIRLILDVHGK